MEYRDYYKVLGLEREATQDEIKRAYRRLARKYHPDVSEEPDAETRFKEVGEAYEVLKDPEKRSAYDQLGANWKAGQDFRPPPGWDQGFEFHGGGFTGAGAEDFSDFFESLFGGGGFGRGFGGRPGSSFRGRGQDTHAKILIDLEDAYTGAARSVTLKHSDVGPDGRPHVRERTLNIRVPRGVRQGQQIRLTGQGEPGRGGGGPGDLYLEVEFRPHRLYQVDGKDVHLDLPLTPWEAALGATIETPTPSGAIELKIPPHSKTGRKLRLKGRGIPASEPGDFYVVLQIALPPADTDAQREAYRQFEEAFEFHPRKGLGA